MYDMKHILYNIERGLAVITLVLALAASSCQQPEPTVGSDVEIFQIVDGEQVALGEIDAALGGQKYEFVLFSNIGEWQLKPTYEEDNEWCKAWPSEGKNDARIAIKVFENDTAYPRTCEMNVVSRGKVMATITFNQVANQPSMELAYAYPDDTKIVNEFGESFKVRIDSNIEWKAEVTYNSGWLALGEKGSDYQELVVTENPTTEERISSVKFRAIGTDIEHMLYIRQGTAEDFNAASKYTIAQTLMLLDEGVGVVSDNIYVQGYVVSDYTSGNFGAKHMVVMDESNSGILVEFEDEFSNVYPVNTLVTLHLKDMAFVTDTTGADGLEGSFGSKIAGFPSARVKFAEPSAGIAPIELHVGDDIANYEYCLVTLKGVEYVIPYGTYLNVNEDFNGDYLDYAYSYSQPFNTFHSEYIQPLRDKSDNIIELYTRRDADFRAARVIPDGSGDITGVVMRRTKSEVPIYHLRMRSLADDQISDDASTRRAKTIMQIGPWSKKKQLDKVTACVGIGTLNTSATDGGVILGSSSVSMYLSNAWARCTPSTLNPENNRWYPLFATAEGVTYFSVRALNWWDNNYNRITDCQGVAWIITTNTTGVEGQLSLDMVFGSSSGGPMHFAVEWATDENAPLDEWKHCGDFIAANASLSNSMKAYTLDLPDACKNQSNLVIRLRVSENMRAKNTSAIDPTGNSQIGVIRLSSR